MEGKLKSRESWKKMHRTVGNACDYEVKTLEKSLLFPSPAYSTTCISSSS